MGLVVRARSPTGSTGYEKRALHFNYDVGRNQIIPEKWRTAKRPVLVKQQIGRRPRGFSVRTFSALAFASQKAETERACDQDR